jgi:hypothetical protein
MNKGKQKTQKWKKQSEELRSIIKQNRDFDPKSNNGPSTFVNVPASNDDYSHCNMCNRKYNEQAYIRHLPTCERRMKDAEMKNKPKGVIQSSNKPNLNLRFKK